MRKNSSESVVPRPEHPLPLSALLSHALVAFTIEFDNEAQHRMPHRTTNYGASAGSVNAPWLVSLVMWFNCMQDIPVPGITVGALYSKALVNRRCLQTILKGMRRWGYLATEPGEKSTPMGEWIVRATEAGRIAQATWQPLLQVIENRWQERFDADAMAELREALSALVEQFDCELPAGLPILEYGLFTCGLERGQNPELTNPADIPLAALFSKVLIMFALEFVSRLKARNIFQSRTADIEARWEVRFGERCIGPLRQCLERLVGEATIETSPLFRGMIPYPDGWRAAVPMATRLPHYPMVLHRGGFPDGS